MASSTTSPSLGYAAILGGGILLFSGVKGQSIRDILAGKHSPIRPLAAPLPQPEASGGGAAATAMTAAYHPTGGTPVQGSPSATPARGRRQAKAQKGLGHFDGHQVALWIIPFLTYARAHGWKGHVESGYRSEAEQRRIYDSGVRPAAVPGTSNHEGSAFPRGAVDVTEAASLAAILAKMPGGSLLQWAGGADPVHFSFPHNGGY